MVCANDKYTYSNIHVLFISLPYYFYKINIFPDVIILNPSTIFQTYNFISYDTSCDYGYVLLYCPKNKNKNKTKQN